MKNTKLILIASIFLAACSNNAIYMTYNSDPVGASLYDSNSRKLGECPVTVKYVPSDRQIEDGQLIIKPVTAVWVSGAKATAPSTNASLSASHKASYTFMRPRNAPNYDTDAKYSLDFQRNRLLTKQNQILTDDDQERATAQPPTVVCTSRSSFGGTNTNCQ